MLTRLYSPVVSLESFQPPWKAMGQQSYFWKKSFFSGSQWEILIRHQALLSRLCLTLLTGPRAVSQTLWASSPMWMWGWLSPLAGLPWGLSVMIPAEASCILCMITEVIFLLLPSAQVPTITPVQKKDYVETRVLSPSIYLSGLHIFQKYCMRQWHKASSAESAGNKDVFYGGQRTPLLPILVSCVGLSHCSDVCCIYPFTVCQTPLQNLPLPLSKRIIFHFRSPF